METPDPIRIERFTAKRTARCAIRGPTAPSKRRALWIAVHGYGQLATDFIGGLGAVDDGSRLLVAPEALSRFYDARSEVGRHAEARVGASWMTREERLHEIDDTVAWLQQAFEEFAAPRGPDVPVTVLGFSQGATAASRWIARGAARVSHLVCWGASVAPELPLGPESPLRAVRLTIVVGERDRFISREAIAAERARLDQAAFPYEFLSFTGGHRLDDRTLQQIATSGG